MPIDERTEGGAPLAAGVDTRRRQLGADEPATVRDRSAGEVIVAVVVALVLASVLNAQDLLATAQRQELGPVRDVALAVTEPLAAVSSTLGLDRPRAAIETALGRRDAPADDPPVLADGDGGDGETPGDGPAGPGEDDADVGDEAPPEGSTPTDPDRVLPTRPDPEPAPTERTPTAEDPLTMYVGGDSMVGQFGVAMDDLADDTGVIETTEVRYEFGSGISRPDFIDWPAELAVVSEEQDPDVVVLYFGGNDAQPLEIDGTVRQPEDPEWQAEYRSRVSALMDQLVDAGHRVYWMGMPIARDEQVRDRLAMLNGIYEDEAETRPEVTFVPVWDLFSGPDGGFSEYLPNESGDEVDMRLDDGIHLTTAGAYRAARPVMERIVADHGIEPPP